MLICWMTNVYFLDDDALWTGDDVLGTSGTLLLSA